MSSFGNNGNEEENPISQESYVVIDIEEIEVEEFSTGTKTSTPPTASGENKENEPESHVGQSTLSDKKKRSAYWDYFDNTDKLEFFKCKYCQQRVRYLSKNGTSVLKNHIERCKLFPSNLTKKQKLLDFDFDDKTRKCVPRLWIFEHELARKAVAKMIIIDELPFVFVEREGFRDLCKVLCPQFNVPSRSTIRRDCYDLFIHERKKLKTCFKNLSSRVSLTTDTWTSGQNLSYMCLTAHFIDDDWKLHKRIINFCPIVGHTGELIGKAVEKCLIEWDVKRILTMTVDNASANDLAVQYLKRRINHWGGGVLGSKYFHMRCAAHILNLVVKDGLCDVGTSIKKVRAAVRYVRSSPARLRKFKDCVIEERIESKKLICLDVETRWNSTFLMLESALVFRFAFDNMKSKGGPYVKELNKCGGPPNDDDWNVVTSFLPFLRIFYDATLKLSGSRYVTSNYYVPEIFGVGYLITTYCDNMDESIKKMAKQMKLKYDKYWSDVDNVNIFLFVALTLDPRHKGDYVEWVVNSSYDVENAKKLMKYIDKSLEALFQHYASSMPQLKKKPEASGGTSSTFNQSEKESTETAMDVQQLLNMRYKMEKGTSETTEKKNELDKYLKDECEPSESGFDVLQWWKDNQKRYPILSMMARDVLAIPVSSVASESAFSTGGRVLDSFRTSLTPRMVEALVCTQDWLRTSPGSLVVEDNFLELEELENSMADLVLEQPTIEIDESASMLEDC